MAAMFAEEEIASAWRGALDLWDMRVELSPPKRAGKSGKGWTSDKKGTDDPLAYIDMAKRQVVVNLPLLEQIGARASLCAVLAHEIGHHVAFPHTLGLAAQLELLEKRLIPGLGESLLNLFFDLLVNERVGRTRARELADVYRGFQTIQGPPGNLFWFYLAVYEELWGAGAGPLVPPGSDAAMEAKFAGCRAEARMFAQTFYALPDIYLQFVYFASVFVRYLAGDDSDKKRGPMSGDVPSPDLDDYGGAIYGSPQVERALEEAKARGWIEEGREPGAPTDPFAAIGQVTSGKPGNQQKAFREALVARHYKRLVDQHLIVLPAVEPPPENFLPTTLEDWETGDDPRAIDWTASVLVSGHLAALRPLRRDLEPEPPDESVVGAVAVEIYLDTSGSMPNPETALNAMTLAAQILSASAIRAKGKVRGVIYSTDAVTSEWMYDEDKARRFFLYYAGGGTRFPFATLARFADEKRDAIRVIISDGDFLWNLTHEPDAVANFMKGILGSRRLVTLLAIGKSWQDRVAAAYGGALAMPKLAVVYVESVGELGRVGRRALASAVHAEGAVSFDLARIEAELDAAPLEPPYPLDLAVAVLADLFRDAGLAPPPDADWAPLCARGSKPDHRPGQLAALARIIAISGMRAETVAALRAAPPKNATALVDDFLEKIFPVTSALIAENAFRREETLRRWVESVGGSVAGESVEAAGARLAQLDYRRTLAEYEKAEKSRLAEAKKRAEALRKAAAEAAEAAKGWRE